MGSRFGGPKQLKQLTPTGETLIDFSLFDAVNAGFKKIVFVVRSEILPEMKSFEQKLAGSADVRFVCQDELGLPEGYSRVSRTKPFGTGHAVLAAAEVNENFCMINADDFYGRKAFKMLAEWTPPAGENEFVMVGFPLKNTLSAHGPVSRGQCVVSDDGFLKSVVERKGILSENGMISCSGETNAGSELEPQTIVSMNFWGFTPYIFELLERGFREFLRKNAPDEDSEFFINDVVNSAVSEGRARVRVLRSDEDWMGITYKEDTDEVSEKLKTLKETGIYPERIY